MSICFFICFSGEPQFNKGKGRDHRDELGNEKGRWDRRGWELGKGEEKGRKERKRGGREVREGEEREEKERMENGEKN
jgi:hypothetical protein